MDQCSQQPPRAEASTAGRMGWTVLQITAARTPTAETQKGNWRTVPAACTGDTDLFFPGLSRAIGSHIAQSPASRGQY